MRCPKCGAVIPDDSAVCEVCGADLEQKKTKSWIEKIRFHGIGFDDPDDDEGYYDEPDEEEGYLDEPDEETEFYDEPDKSDGEPEEGEEQFNESDEIIEDSAAPEAGEEIIDDTADEGEEIGGDRGGGRNASKRTEGESKRRNKPAKKLPPRKIAARRTVRILAAAAAAVLVLIIVAVVVPVATKPERNSPYLGTWKIASLTKDGKESTVQQIKEADTDGSASAALENFSMVLKATGKCTLSVQDQTEQGTWKHNDRELDVTDQRGNQVTFTDSGDGSLTMDLASFSGDGAGVTAKLVKQEKLSAVSTSSQSAVSSSQSSVSSSQTGAAGNQAVPSASAG